MQEQQVVTTQNEISEHEALISISATHSAVPEKHQVETPSLVSGALLRADANEAQASVEVFS